MYGLVNALPRFVALSAYALFRAQKPDCAHVLKFSCFTMTIAEFVSVGLLTRKSSSETHPNYDGFTHQRDL